MIIINRVGDLIYLMRLFNADDLFYVKGVIFYRYNLNSKNSKVYSANFSWAGIKKRFFVFPTPFQEIITPRDSLFIH